MAMRDCPATSFASAPALTLGRELTFEEAREFSRRSKRARVALACLCVAVPTLIITIAYGGTREHVVERTRYALDGSKEVFAEYVGAKKHGRYVEFHRNGRERLIGQFEHDVPIGAFSQFDWNGQLRSTTRYVRGRLDGPSVVFTQDGVKESEVPYTMGTVHGDAVTFWPSGHVRTVKPFRHGVLDGVELAFHESGALAAETTWDGGVAHGAVREWDSAGVLVVEGRHRDGQRDGTWMLHAPTAPVTVETWDMGELVRVAMLERARSDADRAVDAKKRIR